MAINLNGTGSITGLTSISSPGISGVPVGSASAPAFSFTGDTNTGIYSPGADQVAISTNGSERLRITSDGKVGLGTSSPGAKLDIASLGGGSNAVAVILRGDAGTGNSGGLALYNSSTDTNQRNWYLVSNSTTYGDFAIKQGTSQGADPVLGTDRFYISRLGNVGVGTTSVNSKLAVSNGGAESFEFYPADASNVNKINYYNRSGAVYCDAVQNAASHQFAIQGTEKARLDSSGRLLLGTSTVTTTASTATNNLIALESTNNYSGVSFTANCNDSNGSYLVLKKSRGTSPGSTTVVQSGDEIGNIFFEGTDGSASRSAAAIRAFVDGTPGASDMPGRLVFSTTSDGSASPTERMRITSDGKVGLGSSTPTNALTVQSTARPQLHVSYNGNGGIYLTSANDVARTNWQIASSETTANTLQIYPSDSVGGTTFTTPAVTIDASRRVGVGTTGPLAKLAVEYAVAGSGSDGIRLSDTTNTTVTLLGTTETTYSYAGVTGHNTLLYGSRDLAICADNANSGQIKFATGGSEAMRIDASRRLLVGTSSSTMSGGVVQQNGNLGIISNYGLSIATNGTLDITINSGGGCFTGFMIVENTLASNAASRTQTLYAVMGRGTSATFTSLATANGTTSGASFSLSCPSNGVIRVTNTHGGATNINLCWYGPTGY